MPWECWIPIAENHAERMARKPLEMPSSEREEQPEPPPPARKEPERRSVLDNWSMYG